MIPPDASSALAHFDEDVLSLAIVLTVELDYGVSRGARAGKEVKNSSVHPKANISSTQTIAYRKHALGE